MPLRREEERSSGKFGLWQWEANRVILNSRRCLEKKQLRGERVRQDSIIAVEHVGEAFDGQLWVCVPSIAVFLGLAMSQG